MLADAVTWPPSSLTTNNSLLFPPSLCNINFPLALDSNLPVISPLPAVSISNFNWSNLDLNLNVDESPETPDNLPNSIVGCAVVLGIKISPLVAPPVLLNSDVFPIINKPLAVISLLALILPSEITWPVPFGDNMMFLLVCDVVIFRSCEELVNLDISVPSSLNTISAPFASNLISSSLSIRKSPLDTIVDVTILPLALILPEAVIWPPFSLTTNNSLLSPPSLCNINFP